MNIIGLIVARGGSKGLPGKNLRPLNGKPLISWTIDAAQQCAEITRLVISTDDDAIAETARAFGCEVPFMRPASLATDTTSAVDVALHALDSIGNLCDLIVLLQPTSPLRRPADIRACIHRCMESGVPGCVSITQVTESPYWMFNKEETGHLHAVVPRQTPPGRRQDLPAAFLVNGAVYVAKPSWLRQYQTFLGPGVYGYEMPAGRSIDIDTLEDFQMAEALIAKAEN